MEWVTIFWKDEPLLEILGAMAGLGSDVFNRLAHPFTLDYRFGRPDIRHVGDGYFPPALRLPGAILLCPDLVRTSLQIRNVLFALQRRNPSTFARLVSGHLEPQLISTASDMFRCFTKLDVISNVAWENGEIDLLVFDPENNAALHIQAKAPLPAHGVRMVDRLEGRLREGVEQLRRFRGLPQERRDAIIGRAVKRTVTNVGVSDVMLCRSCFGTHELRRASEDVTFISLPVLSGCLLDVEESAASLTLTALLTSCERYLDTIIAAAAPQWTKVAVNVDNLTVRVPTLTYDGHEMERARLKAWRGRTSL